MANLQHRRNISIYNIYRQESLHGFPIPKDHCHFLFYDQLTPTFISTDTKPPQSLLSTSHVIVPALSALLCITHVPIKAMKSKIGFTFCLLTLPRGAPSEAGPVLIQVEEANEALGATLQLDHLCPRLHYTHASFNCKR